MDSVFLPEMTERQVGAISNLGLAHMGDCVFELLCRSYLCQKGDVVAGVMHRDTVKMVCASSQAKFAEAMLPLLNEQEQAVYRRGKNAHVHAVPKSATPAEYAKATGVETLFGYLYLTGQSQRINELFCRVMEVQNGL